MNYKDLKKGSICYLRLKILSKGDFAFTAEAVNENGIPFECDSWHFNNKDALALIPQEHFVQQQATHQ